MPEAPDLDDGEKAALVRDGYDAIAERYLQLARGTPPSHPRTAQTAALLDRLPRDSNVLELGCGAGVPVAEMICRAGHRYTGVDVSPTQIELARHHVPRGTFVVGDALDQHLPSAAFDAVVMLYAVTHVPRDRWAELFHLFTEWLRPRGLLLINVPPRGDPGWLEEDFLGFDATNWTNSHDLSETTRLLAAAGLTVVETQAIKPDGPDDEEWVWILASRRAPADNTGGPW